MTYIDKAKYIMDNYNFCTYQTPISYNGMNVADPSTYFWRLFTPEFYRISHTKETFHNSDYVKFLSEYEYKDELSIKVIKSKGIKCPRCWKILEKNCDRCEKATNV